MVTSNKLPDKKVVKMSEQNNSVLVPQRTLLGEVNEHITCPLCRGYYIDATTIVECLHSFCRSCIIKHLQVKSYCPVCEMMINSAKPNIKLDKALQDIVYKLVPGLFQKEMERRQTFYASRPGPAAAATPEQRGEDTERVIFSPEDVISFSLEYADATDTDSISSKSSDSNEPQPPAASRRYLQCPAVVNVSHLKKFLSMKFDIDSTQFAIDILYKRVPLSDYYTLMDIAYIYNWKRNEPMRFFYQIIDYVAIRNRFFDINRKGSRFRDRKSSPASTEDTNVSSPAPHLNDQGSEASSGTDSPMPEETTMTKKLDNLSAQGGSGSSKSKKSEDEVEKSQFLNSFELKAKNDLAVKISPSKPTSEKTSLPAQNSQNSTVSDDTLKRKRASPNSSETKRQKLDQSSTSPNSLETKGLKLEQSMPSTTSSEFKNLKVNIEKSKMSEFGSKTGGTPSNQSVTKTEVPAKSKMSEFVSKTGGTPSNQSVTKTEVPAKSKMSDYGSKTGGTPSNQSVTKAEVPALKLKLPKVEPLTNASKHDAPKPTVKKIPDLKPTNPQSSQSKPQTVHKLRMDLLANNSDPTIDRSKILSQVQLNVSSPGHTSGDPLKSLFDSCKINIPSSLSITLTDQKQDPRNPSEISTPEQKKPVPNKNLTGSASSNSPAAHKVPSPAVHNYIEILKLPDADPKKPIKPEGVPEVKPNVPQKPEGVSTPPKPKSSENSSKGPIPDLMPKPKSSENSAKGPVPNLKPISDTKLAKQAAAAPPTAANATAVAGGPITFQQTFEQQLQSLQSDKKPKLPKTKTIPKLVPATPKAFNAAKLISPNTKPNPAGIISALEGKASAALDLSTPHTLQSQLSPHQTKAFETMQSIANLAKKQNLPQKGPLQSTSQSFSSAMGRSLVPASHPIRVPPNSVSQMKSEKVSTPSLPGTMRQDIGTKVNQLKTLPSGSSSSPSYPLASQNSPTTAQPSPRQTRSPSSSPKLVIAEEKQVGNPMEQNVNQSNQITSTQLQSNVPKTESPKPSPGPSKPALKPIKPPTPAPNKILPPSLNKPAPPTDFQLMSAHQALLRHQMEMNAWIKAQRQFDLYKNMSNIANQAQNDFKDKQ